MNNATKFLCVAAISSIGHFLSVALYPIAGRYLSPESLSDVGVIDANVMLITSLLGFGLSATATRDVALSKDWTHILRNVQSARLTLSFVFCTISAFMLLFDFVEADFLWYVLLVSPVIAMNYDFLLYGLGKPLPAAVVSFVRQSMPIISFLVALLLFDVDGFYYFFAVVFFLLLSSTAVSVVSGGRLFFAPNRSFLQVYWGAFSIGVGGIFLSFSRYGFVNFYSEMVDAKDFVVLMTFLKSILFAVACKRMLIQFFYNKLLDEKVRKCVDVLCLVSALFCFFLCVVFSEFISGFVFGSAEYANVAVILGFGLFGVSFFVTSDARLLLYRCDNFVAYITVVVCSFGLVMLYFCREIFTLEDILLVVVVIEFLLAFLYWLAAFYKIKYVKRIL